MVIAGGADLSAYPSTEEVQVRGRTQPLRIRIVANALDIAAALDGTADPPTRSEAAALRYAQA